MRLRTSRGIGCFAGEASLYSVACLEGGRYRSSFHGSVKSALNSDAQHQLLCGWVIFLLQHTLYWTRSNWTLHYWTPHDWTLHDWARTLHRIHVVLYNNRLHFALGDVKPRMESDKLQIHIEQYNNRPCVTLKAQDDGLSPIGTVSNRTVSNHAELCPSMRCPIVQNAYPIWDGVWLRWGGICLPYEESRVQVPLRQNLFLR